MKIGKFKKIAAIGLALTMAIGLLYTSGTVNATNDQVQSDQTLSIDDIDKPISVYTNAGPVLKSAKKATNQLIKEENTGVTLNKEAVYNPETKKVDITLESYSTGKVTTTGKPLDIVLVLDQSGSMAQYFGEGQNRKQKQAAMQETVKSFLDDLYNNVKDVENVTHNVGIVTFGSNASILKQILDIKGQSNVGSNWFPRYENNIDILKDAIDGLGSNPSGATSTDEGMSEAEDMLQNRWDNGNDKVVILFTDGVPTTMSDFSDTVANDALASANRLKQSGATVYSVGIFEGADKNFLGSVYDENKTYEENSNSIFSNFADSEKANRFMNLLSSNTPEQENGLSLGIEEKRIITGQIWIPGETTYEYVGYPNGDYERGGWPFYGYEYVGPNRGSYIKVTTEGYFQDRYGDRTVITNNFGCDNQQDPGYFLTADDSDSLNEIFDNIFNQTVVPQVALSQSTVVADTLSEYLVLPDGFNEENVKVYTSEYLGNDDFSDNLTPVNDAKIKVDPTTKKISVSNFDYGNNLVIDADPDKGISTSGKKLVIQFSVDVTPGFIGGNNVPTNDYENSGISDPEISTLDQKFNEEDANIDINYTTDTFDQSIYIGNQYDSFEDFITNGLNEMTYTFNGDEYHLGDEATNQYVDIVYTVKSSDNETVIGTYTVKAGESTGTWILQYGFDTTGLENTKMFNINVDVTSHIPNDQANDSRKAEIDNVTSSLESYLYIFAPELNSHDGELFLGNTENNLNQYVTVNGEGWYCTDTEAENVPQPKGAKPNLDIIVNGTDVSNNSFTPKNVGKYTFTYTVKNNGKPITVAKYNHNSSDTEHSDCHKNDFIINVAGGTINLSKAINSIIDYPLQEDPIFIFKIEQVGNNEVNKTYYRVVRMEHKNDGSFDSSTIPAITGLPAGNYKVTELTSMRFGFVSATLNGEPKNTRSFEFQITENNPIVNISYKNTLEFDDSFSDNDVVVNSFSKNEDGSVKITQDWLNGKGE